MGAQAVGGALQAAGDTQQAIAAGMAISGKRKEARAARREVEAAQKYGQEFADTERARQLGLQQPYMTAGEGALGDLQSFRMREGDPYQAQQFGGVDMANDPGVQYRMNQGREALDASAGAKGSLFSGAQQKALMKYGQDLGSQEYGQAYDRQYGEFGDAETARRDQYNLEANRTMDYDKYRMDQLQGLTAQGQQGSTIFGNQSGNIAQQQLSNEMMLRGHKGDLSGLIAGAPLAGASAVNMTLGKGASSYGRQMGGSGMFMGGGGSGTQSKFGSK